MTFSSDSLPTVPAKMIDTPAELLEVCDHLRKAGRFAFDTEFIGESTYEPVLCLIQVSTKERVELIDPFAVGDLMPLWQLLADPAIEKIVHAGDQDLEIVWLGSGLTSQNVFDTQIAAGFVGTGYPLAYWRLVEQYCGVELGKTQTYSAWDRRPLSHSQFSYAVDDVRYLPAIYDIMAEQLKNLGHLPWMREACGESCIHAATPINARELFMRIKGAPGLSGKSLAILREITAWREQTAYEDNIPPRAILRDELLMDIAQRAPKRETDLSALRGMTPETVVTYGADILAAIEKGAATPPDQYPVMPQIHEDSTEVKRMAETCVAVSQLICLSQSVTPALVFSQADMQALARRIEQKRQLAGLDIMQSWRKECLGDKLVNLINGQLRLHIGLSPDMHIEAQENAER